MIIATIHLKNVSKWTTFNSMLMNRKRFIYFSYFFWIQKKTTFIFCFWFCFCFYSNQQAGWNIYLFSGLKSTHVNTELAISTDWIGTGEIAAHAFVPLPAQLCLSTQQYWLISKFQNISHEPMNELCYTARDVRLFRRTWACLFNRSYLDFKAINFIHWIFTVMLPEAIVMQLNWVKHQHKRFIILFTNW